MARNVISYHELGASFRAAIERDQSDQVNYIPVSRLREQGLVRTLMRARSPRPEATIVAVEDAGSRHFVGPLILLAAAVSSGRITVMWPDHTLEPVRWPTVVAWAWKAAKAQVWSRFAYWRAGRQVKMLDVPRVSKSSATANQAKRVLYLDANLPIGREIGGSVGHIRGVIDALVEQGFRVDYAGGAPASAGLSRAHWFNVPYDGQLAVPPELNCFSFNDTFDRTASKLVAEHAYALIYQRMSVHNFTGALLRRTSGVPLVLEYNGSEAWTAANWGKKLRFQEMAISSERASLRNADLVVTVSDALAEEVVAAGIDRERIVVYPNCIDPLIFDPDRFSSIEMRGLRQELGIGEDARLATFIGTFGRWHGVVFLAKAIRRLIDEDLAWVRANKLHFLLIGDGLKLAEVRALLAEEPYSKFATLTGAVPQTMAPLFLALSDVFVCPNVPNDDGSVFFGSPTKLFEYMAMKRPIVASDLAQIGKVLRGEYFVSRADLAGPMASLFRPGDEGDFLAALRRVVDDAGFARTIAENARRHALDSFTWTHHVDAILARARSLGLIEQ